MRRSDPLETLKHQPRGVVKALYEWLQVQYNGALQDLLVARATEDVHFYRGQVVKLGELLGMLSLIVEDSDD